MKKERSTSYPYMTLPAAIKIAEQARSMGKTISKEMLSSVGRSDATGSIKSGAFTKKVTSLEQFGLITIESGKVIFSDLADEIVLYTDESVRIQSIIKSFLSPETFLELYETLEKNVQISIILLSNKVQKDLKIANNAVKTFVNSFIVSGEYAGLLQFSSEDKSSIILSENNLEKEIAENFEEVESKVADPYVGIAPSRAIDSLESFTLNLSQGRAFLQVPLLLSKQDIERLHKLVDLLNVIPD